MPHNNIFVASALQSWVSILFPYEDLYLITIMDDYDDDDVIVEHTFQCFKKTHTLIQNANLFVCAVWNSKESSYIKPILLSSIFVECIHVPYACTHKFICQTKTFTYEWFCQTNDSHRCLQTWNYKLQIISCQCLPRQIHIGSLIFDHLICIESDFPFLSHALCLHVYVTFHTFSLIVRIGGHFLYN